MAQVKLLKINSDGVPQEFNSTSDDITLNSFTIQGGGPVLSGTGLDMNNQDVSDVNDLAFNNPATGTINQTAGSLIVDNLMAKERSNTLTTAADILFPVVSDTAGQVDALRLPAIAGSPTATPTASGEGFVVWDSTNNKMFVWDGAAWDDQSTVQSAQYIDDVYQSGEAIAVAKAVYISDTDVVSKSIASADATSRCIGFSTTAAAGAAEDITIRKHGTVPGFTGLTPGARYYVDASTAGDITSTAPTGTGNVLTQVGFARAATQLDIQILNLGRRA